MAKKKQNKNTKITRKIQKELNEKFLFPRNIDKNTGYRKAKELGYSTEIAKNIKNKENLENLWNVSEKFRSRSVGEFFYRETFGKGSKKPLTTETGSRTEFKNFVDDLANFWDLTPKEKNILKRDIETQGLFLSDFEKKSVREDLFSGVKNNGNVEQAKDYYKKIFGPIARNSKRSDFDDWLKKHIAGFTKDQLNFYNKTNRLSDQYNSLNGGLSGDKTGFVYADRIMNFGDTPKMAEEHIKLNVNKSSTMPDKVIYVR
jgi:hypothetical protein